jgi:hypothetical protein
MKFRITGRIYPPAGPPLLARATGLAGTLARSVKLVARGKSPVAGRDEVARRRSICQACEHFTIGPPRAYCKLCGCVAAWKLPALAARCPANRWLRAPE